MTKRLIVFLVTLSFMSMFMASGLAAVTDNLKIRGTAKTDIPEGLFITKIEPNGTSNMGTNNYSFEEYSTTVKTTLKKSKTGAASASYKITVFNNTKLEYAYRNIYYQSNLTGYNNSLVSTSSGNGNIYISTTFPEGKIVGPGETLVFYVTYNLGSSLNRNTTYKNLINFQFGINVESEAAAREVVYEKFLNILNTPTTYNELIEKIDDKFDGNNEWTSNYIGNVSDAVDADSMTVETLFAGQLNMMINGQMKPATVLIKRENLDWIYTTGDKYSVTYSWESVPTDYAGCEMTLYLTTDPLTTPNGQAPVYVSVFTCDSDYNGNKLSDWYRIGDTYGGLAPIVGYSGGYGQTGSFVTDNWVADGGTYTPVEGYSYTVTQGQTIGEIVRVVDPAATAKFQSLLNDAKDLIDDLTYAGTGITYVEDAYYAASRHYSIDGSGRPVANAETTRAQLIPLMIDLDYAIQKAREAIEALPNN